MINQQQQLQPHRFLEVRPRFLEANLRRLHLQPSQPQQPQPLAELLLKPHLHLFLEIRNLYLEEVRPRRPLQQPPLLPRPVQQPLQPQRPQYLEVGLLQRPQLAPHLEVLEVIFILSFWEANLLTSNLPTLMFNLNLNSNF